VSQPTVADTRTPQQIEADLDAARDRLSSTVDTLSEELTPQAMVRRLADNARGFFTAPDGQLRQDRVIKVAAVVVGLLVLRSLVRHRSR
jgi:Protein of unknown function (DUF3618)